MAIFTKGLIGAGLAGTIALGAMVTWDGGTTVISAKDKITEAATQIGVFKQNETALVSKVTSLKTEKATLKAEVAALKVELQLEKDKGVTDKARIVELEAEIATKNAKITELESEIATLNTDLENAAGNTDETVERINALEAELNAANEQAEALQYTLDTTVLESSDQAAVDAALLDDEGTVDPLPGPDPDPSPYTELAMVESTPVTVAAGLEVDKRTDVNGTNLIIENDNSDSFAVSVDGVKLFDIAGPGGFETVGSVSGLDGKHLNIKNNRTGTSYDFTLVNK